MDEDVLIAGHRLDEPITLSRVEPLDGAFLHRLSPGLDEKKTRPRCLRATPQAGFRMSAQFLGRETHSRTAKIRLCLILQHEICALASFWYGSGNQFSDEAARRRLWPQNNITRQSPIDGDRDRLTVRENWGQIGTGGGGFSFFVELAV